jgi:hypothetical protein
MFATAVTGRRTITTNEPDLPGYLPMEDGRVINPDRQQLSNRSCHYWTLRVRPEASTVDLDFKGYFIDRIILSFYSSSLRAQAPIGSWSHFHLTMVVMSRYSARGPTWVRSILPKPRRVEMPTWVRSILPKPRRVEMSLLIREESGLEMARSLT